MDICNLCTSTILGGRIPQGARKAVRLCLLLFSALFSVSPAATLANSACSSEQYDEITTIRYIHDGDTLHLGDGRKIRLIGINTPELARNNKTAEPYAKQAKSALKALFKTDKSIALLYGNDKKDRYNRLLAHGFLSDGRNIQAILLKQGLASAITVPPNTKFASCYLELEHKARCNKAGLWQNTKILEAKNIKTQHLGFQLIRGKVKKIHINSKGIWLNIDNKLTVGVRPDNQQLFDIKSINNMLSQIITVRGWLNESSKSTPFYMRVRHPSSIQLSTAFACN